MSNKNQDEGDDIKVKITPVDLEPNPVAVLPAGTILALDLKMVWRNYGTMESLKIPFWECDFAFTRGGGMPFPDKDYKCHIAKYDLLHEGESAWDCIAKGVWCVLIEKEVGGETYKIGAMVSEEVVWQPDILQKQITGLINRLTAKFKDKW